MNQDLEKIIIAHRGASFMAPENTLSSINLAWKNSVNAVEIDVRLTKDNQIVAIHDENTKRTGDRFKSIRKSSLEELRDVDVGLFKGEKWKGERIPTLAAVFQAVPNNGKIIVEIKSGNKIIKPLVALIQNSDLQAAQIELIAYNRILLKELKKLLPEIKMLWILDLDFYLPAWILFINKRRIIRTVIESNLDGVDVWSGKVLDKRFVKLFKEHNLEVYCWTVNDLKMAERLIEMGIDGLTTDRPAWLKNQLLKKSL